MNPYYADDSVTLYAGDCLDVLAELPDDSVDAVVTDPPYGLEFMGKEWDSFAPRDRKNSTVWDGRRQAQDGWQEDAAARSGKGGGGPSYRSQHKGSKRCDLCGKRQFSGSPCVCPEPEWTVEHRQEAPSTMLAFQAWCTEWSRECYRVLKPGGHLLAFGGTRTWHRLACAVEDAGFEIRDSIAWLYGSGFPKSLDVSKAIDKRPGVARHAEFADQMYGRRLLLGYSRADVSEAVVGTRSGACWNWEHHQFPEVKWWPKLKAFLHMEDKWDAVIADAERARVGTRTTGRGTGGGATPVIGDSGNYDITAPATDAARQWQGWGTALKPGHEPIVVARKPLIGTVAANVQAWGTGALNIDGCRIGERVETWPISRGPNTRNSMAGGVMAQTETGSAPAGRWPANVTLDENQAAALDQQSGTLTSGLVQPHHADAGKDDGIYGAMPGGGGRSSFGDTGGASRFFYTAKADAGERIKLDGIAHPTVKPLSLMRWLVRLVCPPGGVVLEPFAGSGTTVEACILEGFRCIAIEREADYLPLITQRINRRRDPVAAVLAGGEDAGLFDLLGDLEVLEELGEETA